MGQITATQNLVAIKEVRHAGQKNPLKFKLGIIVKPEDFEEETKLFTSSINSHDKDYDKDAIQFPRPFINIKPLNSMQLVH